MKNKQRMGKLEPERGSEARGITPCQRCQQQFPETGDCESRVEDENAGEER